MVLIQNDKQEVMKKNFLLKIIQNQNSNIERSFHHWWKFTLFSRLIDDKKKLVIDMLTRFTNNSERVRLRSSLKQFYTNGRISKIKK